MKVDISIPKELLAQIDFANTVNGGMIESTVNAWREEDGYKLILKAPSIDIENIQIQTANQRFMVYSMMPVLEGQEELPYFLVNLPLSPEVDVERISAKFEDGRIFIRAPFNDWAKGESHFIDIDKY
jgi:HSP20 family protein